MSELKNKLMLIKNEKDTKLIPENIKEGVTILGITGTLSGGSDCSKLTIIIPKAIAEAYKLNQQGFTIKPFVRLVTSDGYNKRTFTKTVLQDGSLKFETNDIVLTEGNNIDSLSFQIDMGQEGEPDFSAFVIVDIGLSAYGTSTRYYYITETNKPIEIIYSNTGEGARLFTRINNDTEYSGIALGSSEELYEGAFIEDYEQQGLFVDENYLLFDKSVHSGLMTVAVGTIEEIPNPEDPEWGMPIKNFTVTEAKEINLPSTGYGLNITNFSEI